MVIDGQLLDNLDSEDKLSEDKLSEDKLSENQLSENQLSDDQLSENQVYKLRIEINSIRNMSLLMANMLQELVAKVNNNHDKLENIMEEFDNLKKSLLNN